MSEVVKEIQKTLVILKPDAVERGLMGEILGRLERKGLKMVRVALMTISKETAAQHYAHLTERPFYPELEAYITRGPALVSVWEGRDAINVVRRLVGLTEAALAAPGTIRGDFGNDDTENLIHASDSTETALIEIKRFFNE